MAKSFIPMRKIDYCLGKQQDGIVTIILLSEFISSKI